MAVDQLEIRSNEAGLIIILLTCTYILLLTPLSLYYAHKLWSLNNANISFVTKRHPKVVIFSVLLFNGYTTIIRPLCDLSLLYGLNLGLFGIFLSNLSQLGLVIISLRVWLLFYDYQHQNKTLTMKWKTQITKTDLTLPWTTQYKWMGNVKTLVYICSIIGFAVLIITFVCYVLFGGLYLVFKIIIHSFFIMFISGLIWNVRACRDEFFVQKELKIILKWMIVMGILYCGLIIPLLKPETNVWIVVMNVWVSVSAYMLSLVPTYWVFHWYQTFKVNNQKKKAATPKSSSKLPSPKSSSECETRLTLEEILKTKDGFDVFANHLIREWSIENLFFVFEIMQTKNEILSSNKYIELADIGLVISIDIGRMHKLRRVDSSHISNVNDLRQTWKYIMKQYIVSGSEFSVNISSNTRIGIGEAYNSIEGGGKLVIETAIADIDLVESEDRDDSVNSSSNHDGRNTIQSVDFGKMNDTELIKQYIVIFDQAIAEIMHLLKTDTLLRFYSSKEYKIMIRDQKAE